MGRTYQIVLWGALVGRDLTLGIPAINGVHDSDGGFLPNTYADFTDEEDGHEHDGPGSVPVFGGDAELVFTSLPGCPDPDPDWDWESDDVPECINIETTCTDDDTTCTYYVAVMGRGEYTGTYELWVTDITEEDDAQPANTRTTTFLLRNADDTYDPVEGR